MYGRKFWAPQPRGTGNKLRKNQKAGWVRENAFRTYQMGMDPRDTIVETDHPKEGGENI